MSISFKLVESARPSRRRTSRIAEASTQLVGVTETIRRLAAQLTHPTVPASTVNDLRQAASSVQVLTSIIRKQFAGARPSKRRRLQCAEDASPRALAVKNTNLQGLALKLGAAASLIQSLTDQINNELAREAMPAPPTPLPPSIVGQLQMMYANARHSADKRMNDPATSPADSRRLSLYDWAIEGASAALAAGDHIRCKECVKYACSFYNLLDAK